MKVAEAYKTVVENVDIPIFLIEVIKGKVGDYRFAYLNRAYEQQTGIPNNLLVGEKFERVVDIIGYPEKDMKFSKKFYNKAVRTKETVQYYQDLRYSESLVDTSVEKISHWIGTVYPVVVNGKVAYIVGTAIDITELKSTQNKLQESNMMLEQAAYAAAHDLQTPIRNITSFVKKIAKSAKEKDISSILKYLPMLEKYSENARLLIDATLEYSKFGLNESKFETVNLSEIVEESRCNLKELIQETKAEVKNNLPTTLRILGDKSQLVVVFMNLIKNGIVHNTKNEKQVIIALDNTFRHLMEFTVIVTDNGNGIEMQPLERIFQPYLKGKSSKGSGIGLAVANRVMTRHGGAISAQTRKGTGTKFLLTFKKQGDD
jgi:signal transduction histidine kinase